MDRCSWFSALASSDVAVELVCSYGLLEDKQSWVGRTVISPFSSQIKSDLNKIINNSHFIK